LPSQKVASGKEKMSLTGVYAIGILATAIGLTVIVALNMLTPLEYILQQLNQGALEAEFFWGRLIARRFFGLLFLVALSGSVLFLIMRQILKPVSVCLSTGMDVTGTHAVVVKAKQRLINLPFMMIPINIGMWVLIPFALFYAGYASGRIEALAAWTLGIRSTMVGLISSAIMSFWLENYNRKRFIPHFFPKGRLGEIGGIATISISRRIRLLYRLGSLTPLAILVVTLITLQWQVGQMDIDAGEYGRGILIFSISLFVIFFIGSGVLNRLISRSIAQPVNAIMASINDVKMGNYDTHIPVVGNDEIGMLGDAANEMIQGLAEREILRDAFGKYVAPEVRDEILSGKTPLDGELRNVTILFGDIRDFTPMTASHDPKLVVKMLNSYFAAMAEAIQAQSGLVLQFLGDEIYAVFGAPVHLEDHPSRAFGAAILMKEKLVDLNRHFLKKGWPVLRHGIGVHTGDAVVANIGSPERLSYMLVGDTVNMASRLQGLTREIGCEIIISKATHQSLGDVDKNKAAIVPLSPMRVKGKNLPMECFKVS